jgi:hypothetical protein
VQGKWNRLINQASIEYRPGLPTIQQLQSSGNLRLIESRIVGNKILEYQAFVKGNVERLDDNIFAASQKVFGLEDALCDYRYFVTVDLGDKESDSAIYEMPLVVRDPARINEFANSFVNYKAVNSAYNRTVLDALKYATELIKLINDEYHFQKE